MQQFNDRPSQKVYLLMLLQQVVQVVTSLVIEIEVLALCLTFGAHHLGNGCPVSTMLNKPWRGMKRRQFYVKNLNLI